MQDVWESAKKGALGSMGCFFLLVGGVSTTGTGWTAESRNWTVLLNRIVGRNVNGWDVLTRKEGVDTALEHAAGKVLHDRLGL